MAMGQGQRPLAMGHRHGQAKTRQSVLDKKKKKCELSHRKPELRVSEM